MSSPSPQVVVVLGCRVREHRPSSALGRRLTRAVEVSVQHPQLSVILSGGREWQGTSESQAMRNWWTVHGTDADLICENESLTTAQNAACVARLCKERGCRSVHLVTCDFHMSRAAALFERQGLSVTRHPARSPTGPWLRFRLVLREWGARALFPFETLIK